MSTCDPFVLCDVAGIDEIAIDMKGQKLTIIGTVDPISVVSKLRKFWPSSLLSVGPAKEPEKKEEAKKEEPKKEEAKKEEGKEEPKKEEAKKEEPKKEEQAKKEEEKKPVLYYPQIGTAMPYRPYHPQMHTTYYYPQHSMDENPNACVIF